MQPTSNIVSVPAEQTQPTQAPVAIHFPGGLLGFESAKRWLLAEHPSETPFLRLTVRGDSGVEFLLVPPAAVIEDYRPELADSDVAALQLNKPGDALVLNIVTLQPTGRATVNLKGPIVINRRTHTGKQVVPLNAAAYALLHPLPVAN